MWRCLINEFSFASVFVTLCSVSLFLKHCRLCGATIPKWFCRKGNEIKKKRASERTKMKNHSTLLISLFFFSAKAKWISKYTYTLGCARERAHIEACNMHHLNAYLCNFDKTLNMCSCGCLRLFMRLHACFFFSHWNSIIWFVEGLPFDI